MPIQTAYGPDSVTTTTSGYPSAAASPLLDAANEIIRRRLEDMAQPREAPRPVLFAGAQPRQRVREPQQQERPAFGTLEEQAQRLALSEAKRRAAAASRPPPMKTSSGFNMAPHLELDLDRMNAIERELYLPQASGMASSPDDEARAGLRAQRDQDFMRSFGTPLYSRASPDALRAAQLEALRRG